MAENDRRHSATGRPTQAYGGASVEERAQAMRGTMSDEDIAARNVIPETAPNGKPHRQISEEYFSENDTFTRWNPEGEVDTRSGMNTPGPASQEELKPGVLREAKKITDRIPAKLGIEKLTQDSPEYWGLASVMTEEEAQLTSHMKVRVPETFQQVVEGSGMNPARVEQLLDDLCIKGIIEYNWENLDGKNPQHERRYLLPMFVPGSAEFTVMNQRQMEEHPEIGSFFNNMTYLPLTVATKLVPPGGAGVGMHTIPVEYAIKQESHSASVEHISHWLKKYDRYSAGACSCGLAERARGVNGGRDPQNWCIGVGDMADYCVETGKGHFVTYDEVIDILLQAERNGYVHQITNIDGEEKIFAICNCDATVCYALRTSQLFNTPNMSASAYRAHIDEEKCVACAGCVEVCPAGAVQLGQKLPTKQGPQSYPKQPLPDARSWSECDWDWDYKNNNRIECHESGTAPCKVACPAHVSVQGYLRLAAQGRYRDALALIKRENPFPAVCGRVCNKRCEAACTRGTVDDAVAIDDVKRFIAAKDLEAEQRFVPEPTIPSTRGRLPEKIAIIGSGPAGLTCAYYLADMGYQPVVFEREDEPGGMLTYGIPFYKLDKSVVEAEIDVMREMGVEIRCGVNVGEDVSLDELREQGFKAFYLAIGCQESRKLNVPGEEGEGVISALKLLHAAYDDPLLSVDGNVVVIGGGNVAMDAARVARRCGADDVKLYCLEQRDEMPATPLEIAEAEEDKVQVSGGWGPASIELDEKGHVRAVTFKRCLSVYAEDGSFSPTYDESETMLVPCDHVVLAVGQRTDWGTLLAGSSAAPAPGSRVQVDPKTFQSAADDIFIGGDALTGPSFVIDAIAQGHEAAISLHRFVQTGSSLTLGRNQRHYVELDKDDILLNPSGYDHGARQEAEPIEPYDGVRYAWEDYSGTFDEEQVRAECARCLSCGASIVDQNKCIGCGLCTTRCEFDAIHLSRDVPEASRMWKSEDKVKAVLPYAAKRSIKILRGKKGPLTAK